MRYDREFLSGTVTVLILSLLSERPMYGYEMLREIEARSAKEFLLKEGTLYPALHTLERAGVLRSQWREAESGRQRKYYALTAKGRRHAKIKRHMWESVTAATQTILVQSNG